MTSGADPGTYNRHVAEHLRLTILRLLDASGSSANDSVLTDAARPLGFHIGRDRVRTELAWLTEQGLVTLEAVAHLTVATLTERGHDVAAGHAIVPGVKRPMPR